MWLMHDAELVPSPRNIRPDISRWMGVPTLLGMEGARLVKVFLDSAVDVSQLNMGLVQEKLVVRALGQGGETAPTQMAGRDGLSLTQVAKSVAQRGEFISINSVLLVFIKPWTWTCLFFSHSLR